MRAALGALRDLGYRVAIIGNQPSAAGDELRALGIEAEVMAMSEDMGTMKPDPDFFAKTLRLLGRRAKMRNCRRFGSASRRARARWSSASGCAAP